MGDLLQGEALIYERVDSVVYARYRDPPHNKIPRWIIGGDADGIARTKAKEPYRKIGDNNWLIEVQENGKTKELFIEFPPGCLDQVGWDVGDTLIWEELDHGAWSIKKAGQL